MHCHVENHAVEGMGVVLNEAQPNQNPSPQAMRQCGNFGPTLAEFYRWLEFDPNNPTTSAPPTTAPCKQPLATYICLPSTLPFLVLTIY